jgi:hypothetical protein
MLGIEALGRAVDESEGALHRFFTKQRPDRLRRSALDK